MPNDDSKLDKRQIAGERNIEHPRAMGAPSGSINDDEYRESAKATGGGVDDPGPANTEPGDPVPVLADDAGRHAHELRRAKEMSHRPAKSGTGFENASAASGDERIEDQGGSFGQNAGSRDEAMKDELDAHKTGLHGNASQDEGLKAGVDASKTGEGRSVDANPQR